MCADEQGADQDVHHSIRVSEVEGAWQKCLNIHQALGRTVRELPRDRDKPRARMGLVAGCNLVAGEILTLDRVDFAFPAAGIATEHWDIVEGWTLTNDLSAGDVLHWHDLKSSH